jgi:hypothetical protein
MENSSIETATETIALLHLVLQNIDLLSSDELVFNRSLKYKGSAFVGELEKFTKDFYKNLKEEGELELYRRIKNIESAVKSAIEVEKTERDAVLLKN